MEHKQAAASGAEDAALHVKKTPSNDSGTVIVTPERAEKPRHNEGGGYKSNMIWPRPRATLTRVAEEQVSEEAENEQESIGDNDGNNDDGETPAVVVNANKPLEAFPQASTGYQPREYDTAYQL